jgi:hypothetical protein
VTTGTKTWLAPVTLMTSWTHRDPIAIAPCRSVAIGAHPWRGRLRFSRNLRLDHTRDEAMLVAHELHHLG